MHSCVKGCHIHKSKNVEIYFEITVWWLQLDAWLFFRSSWDLMESPLKATRSWSPLVSPESSSWAVKSFHPSFHEYELRQVRVVSSSLVVFCISEGQSTVSFSLVGQPKSRFSLTSSTPLRQGTVIFLKPLQWSRFLACFSENTSLKSNSTNQDLKVS